MKIAIQGHPTRGKEVIQILENLGGKKVNELTDTYETFYYINDKNEISDDHKRYIPSTYKLYTLEEFEKEFPFKIGDIVQTVPNGQPGIITELCLDHTYVIVYKIRYNSKRELVFPSQMLKLYTPMKEERNITLTLDKAKEWYNKGGELKEIALQAFTKEELNPLPKSWEEYCKAHYVVKTDCVFGPYTPIKYIALWRLERLRNCYRQGWKPKPKECAYVIKYADRGLAVYAFTSQEFLSFQSKEIAEEFLKNFERLIKEAGDVI